MMELMLYFAALIMEVYALNIYETNSRQINCKKSRIDRNVTLAKGYDAGKFVRSRIPVKTMKDCVAECCRTRGCDVAFFTNSTCYKVKCRSLTSCEPSGNDNPNMNTLISYVARPSVLRMLEASRTGEPAIEDELISEFTSDSPFAPDRTSSDSMGDSDDPMEFVYSQRRARKEWKDMVIAVGCGFMATAVGVVGVIMMTRRLVDDDEFDYVMNERVNLSKTDSQCSVSDAVVINTSNSQPTNGGTKPG